MDRTRPACGRHGARPRHGRGAEGRQRPPRHGDEPGSGGDAALPALSPPRPDRPGLVGPRPVRAVRRALQPDALHPALPVRLRPRARRPQVAAHLGLADAGAPRARAHARRRDDDRPAGPGCRQRGRHGHGGPPRARPARPGGPRRPEPLRPQHLGLRLRRRHRGGPEQRGVLDRRGAAAGQPDPAVGRQPHLDRGRHEHRARPRTSPAATQRSAGTCSGSTGSTTTARTTRTSRRSRPPTTPPWPSPTDRRSSRCARSSPGPRPTSRTPARRTGRPSATTRWRPPSGCSASTRPARSRSTTRCSRTRARSSSGAGGARRVAAEVRRVGCWQPRRQGAARPHVGPPAARGLDVGAAGVPGRRQGHGHPQGVRQRAHRHRTGAARAVGRLGRPGRVEQHDPRGRAVVPARRPPVQGVPRRSRTAGSCTSGSASTRWARSSTASPCTAGRGPTAARSSCSATTCARPCASPR